MPVSAPPSTRTFAPSTIIAAEGELGGGWFVLLSGRVGVFRREAQVDEFATRGMILGEISSILAQPRTASLVALEETTLLHVDLDLEELMLHHPKVVKTLVMHLAQRVDKSTESLAEMQRLMQP